MCGTCSVLLYDCVTYIPKIAILKTLVGTDLYTLLYALGDYKKIDTNNISFYCLMKLCMTKDNENQPVLLIIFLFISYQMYMAKKC